MTNLNKNLSQKSSRKNLVAPNMYTPNMRKAAFLLEIPDIEIYGTGYPILLNLPQPQIKLNTRCVFTVMARSPGRIGGDKKVSDIKQNHTRLVRGTLGVAIPGKRHPCVSVTHKTVANARVVTGDR